MNPPESLVTGVVLALSIGSVSYTTSSSKISAPLRVAVITRGVRSGSKPMRWLGDLLSCPYCVSHWLAFAATIVYRPWLVDANLSESVAPGWVGRVFDFLVTSMALVTMSMVAVWLIKRALAPVASPAPEQRRVERRPSPPTDRVVSHAASPDPGRTQVVTPQEHAHNPTRADVTMTDGVSPTDRTQQL